MKIQIKRVVKEKVKLPVFLKKEDSIRTKVRKNVRIDEDTIHTIQITKREGTVTTFEITQWTNSIESRQKDINKKLQKDWTITDASVYNELAKELYSYAKYDPLKETYQT